MMATVVLGLRAAALLAEAPTLVSFPLIEMTDGVVLAPSSLIIIVGVPFSITATALFTLPKSNATIFFIFFFNFFNFIYKFFNININFSEIIFRDCVFFI